ncbi:AglZ/HisF2 family acetamidino modification protein [Rufibacter soli]
MFRPRIIAVLLLNNGYLVKSKSFKNYSYIGDPINAVRIFNDFKADELVFLDISATRSKRTIPFELIKSIAEEAVMPFSVGGGIKELSQIKDILSAGVEKVVIGNYAVENPNFIKLASNEFGSSSISVCMDVKRTFFGGEKVWRLNGTKVSSFEPIKFAQLMAEFGAGEIIIQSILKDGQMKGYDFDLIKRVSEKVTIPTVALGGAGSMNDLKRAYLESYAVGLAAGSLFVYYGSSNGVLINYPDRKDFIF